MRARRRAGKEGGWTILAVAWAAVMVGAARVEAGAQGSGEAADIWQGHVKGVTDVAFLANGEEAVSCGLDGTIRLWDAQAGRLKKVLARTRSEVFALSVSGDGRTVAACDYQGRIAVIATSGGKVRYIQGIKGWSADIALSPDARLAAVWSMDGEVRIFDLETGESGLALKGQTNRWGMALAWSPDGKQLAAGRSVIEIWDVGGGAVTKTLEGHKELVRGLAFSPDGRRLASAGMDKTVRIWDLEAGKLLYALEPSGMAVFTEAGAQTARIRLPMTAVAFATDGAKLATAGADRVVRLWDAADGKPGQELVGHRMTVTALAFSPDGKRLLSASLDRTIRAWSMD